MAISPTVSVIGDYAGLTAEMAPPEGFALRAAVESNNSRLEAGRFQVEIEAIRIWLATAYDSRQMLNKAIG